MMETTFYINDIPALEITVQNSSSGHLKREAAPVPKYD
jgi:hypothetical protein